MARFKTFLLSFLIAALSIVFISGCSTEEGTGGNTNDAVPVESIKVTSQPKTYFRGSNITIDFEITPTNTTQNQVEYKTDYNGSGFVTVQDGKGQLVLQNVTVADTVVFTIANGQTASYQLVVEDDVSAIYFPQASYTIEQNASQTVVLENQDVLQAAFTSIVFSVSDDTKASINSVTGEVTGLKNGVVTVTATATKADGSSLTATYELDVVGLVDFTSNDTFKESAQGTYNITFFGTNPGQASGFMGSQTEVPVTTDCELYKQLFSASKCEGGGFVKNIIVNPNDFVGRATISINPDGSAVIHTKILMTASTMASNSPNDQYQYSVYKTTSGTDTNNKNGTVKGITGRHLTANGTWDTSTFDVRQYKNNLSKEIILYSNLIGKKINVPIIGEKTVNPITYVVMEKISSKPEKMDYSNISVAPFDKVTGINPTDLGEDAPSY